MKKILTALLIASVLTASAGPSLAYAEFTGYSDRPNWHTGVNYYDMDLEPYDEAVFRAILEDMRSKMNDASNADDVLADFDKINPEFNILHTKRELYYIHYHGNSDDTQYADLYQKHVLLFSELYNEGCAAIREVLCSACGDALKSISITLLPLSFILALWKHPMKKQNSKRNSKSFVRNIIKKTVWNIPQYSKAENGRRMGLSRPKKPAN